MFSFFFHVYLLKNTYVPFVIWKKMTVKVKENWQIQDQIKELVMWKFWKEFNCCLHASMHTSVSNGQPFVLIYNFARPGWTSRTAKPKLKSIGAFQLFFLFQKSVIKVITYIPLFFNKTERFNNEGLKIAHCLQREATKRTTYAYTCILKKGWSLYTNVPWATKLTWITILSSLLYPLRFSYTLPIFQTMHNF